MKTIGNWYENLFFFLQSFEHHRMKPNFRVDYKCWNISLIVVWLCDCVFSRCYRVNAHIMTSKNSRQLNRIYIKSHIITENVTLFCKISNTQSSCFTCSNFHSCTILILIRCLLWSSILPFSQKTRPFIISELTICFATEKKRDTKYTALEGLWMGHMHVFEWWSSKEAYPMILNNIFYGPWVFHKQAFVFRWRIPKKCSNYKMIFVTKRAVFVLRARNIFDRIFFFFALVHCLSICCFFIKIRFYLTAFQCDE